MFKYINTNPFKRNTNDYFIRALSIGLNETWDEIYQKISDKARKEGKIFINNMFIQQYLKSNFKEVYNKGDNNKILLKDFIQKYNQGTYIIVVRDYITCCIDGIVYDTFNPYDRIVLRAYEIEKEED